MRIGDKDKKMNEADKTNGMAETEKEYVGSIITPPVVFLAGDTYQIVFETDITGIARVIVGNDIYTDNTNGVVRSEDTFHKIILPTEVLDSCGEYTVEFAHIADRKPYFPQSGEFIREHRRFFAPGKNPSVKLYMLSDTHTRVSAPSVCGDYFGDELDMLILAGDIGNSASNVDLVKTIHRIAENILHGEKPCVFVRGNHDTRGKYAELLPSIVGNVGGDTFFSFRVGNVWCVGLDCGEDKIDSHAEYGDIADYRHFRERETRFLRSIIKNKSSEYEAEGIEHKIAICHVPFTVIVHDFADDIYNEWTKLLNEIGIEVMLTGHKHKIEYHESGKLISEGKTVANFPVVVGARMSDDPLSLCDTNNDEFTATALELFSDGEIDLKFTNSKKEIIKEIKVKG